MSDIQPTDADREEAYSTIAAILRAMDGDIVEGKPGSDCLIDAKIILEAHNSRIRSDAVKAERERCIRRIRFEMLDDRYLHTLNRLEQAILSDDHEAHRG